MENFKKFLSEQSDEKPYKIICFFHTGDSSRDIQKNDQIGMMKTMNKYTINNKNFIFIYEKLYIVGSPKRMEIKYA